MAPPWAETWVRWREGARSNNVPPGPGWEPLQMWAPLLAGISAPSSPDPPPTWQEPSGEAPSLCFPTAPYNLDLWGAKSAPSWSAWNCTVDPQSLPMRPSPLSQSSKQQGSLKCHFSPRSSELCPILQPRNRAGSSSRGCRQLGCVKHSDLLCVEKWMGSLQGGSGHDLTSIYYLYIILQQSSLYGSEFRHFEVIIIFFNRPPGLWESHNIWGQV